MIYLFTALYCEAQIFIKRFRLEKNLESMQFQEFYNETAGIRFVITGVGEIAAAAAVASVCTKYKPKDGDMLLNVGICAHTGEGAGIFVCNKITEQATGKTFYPDILYRHNFKEEAIVTGMTVWNGKERGVGISETVSAGTLYDMEAAAVYQAGSYFFGPHQMIFLKIVSDKGTVYEVSKKQAEHLRIERLMEASQEILIRFVEQCLSIAGRNTQQESNLLWENGQLQDKSMSQGKGILQEEVLLRENLQLQENAVQQDKEALIEKLCIDLHCSKVMRDSMQQHIRYLTLSGTDYVSAIQAMYREGLLPCKDKREGKLRFEELKRRLL